MPTIRGLKEGRKNEMEFDSKLFEKKNEENMIKWGESETKGKI